jgi:predicted DNA binding CopG/RHH family protein
MKILLPPSEKKNEPEKLKALKLNALSFQADLTTTRTALLKKHKEVDISHCDVASNI